VDGSPLLARIEELRQTLSKLVDSGLTLHDPRVITVSRQLDRLIVEYLLTKAGEPNAEQESYHPCPPSGPTCGTTI
jgi:hypothetical protein